MHKKSSFGGHFPLIFYDFFALIYFQMAGGGIIWFKNKISKLISELFLLARPGFFEIKTRNPFFQNQARVCNHYI